MMRALAAQNPPSGNRCQLRGSCRCALEAGPRPDHVDRRRFSALRAPANHEKHGSAETFFRPGLSMAGFASER